MHSLSEIRNVLEFQNWSQVSHFIVFWGWSQHLKKAREILMIFNMLKFHSNFIATNMSVWNILLQNGTSAFPGSLSID